MPSHIYAIAASARGPTKIGFADKPIQRLNDLQVGNPQRLRIFFAALVDDALSLERAAHRHFKRRRAIGEWFRIGPAQAKSALISMMTVNRITWSQWTPSADDLKKRQAQIGNPDKPKPLHPVIAERMWQMREWGV